MSITFTCLGCGKELARSKRSGDRQSHCGEQKCQRARKAEWHRRKVAVDPDYRIDQERCDQAWRQENRHYWRDYRQDHPLQNDRNRFLQRRRNQARRRPTGERTPGEVIAKMDAFQPGKMLWVGMVGEFGLIPVIAKMDALKVRITAVSDG